MKQNFAAGDYIIDFANLYQITAVEANGKGEPDDNIIHYKPVQGTDKVFTAAIPEKNLKKSGLRRILTTEEVKQVMLELVKPVKENYVFNQQFIKEEIYQNLPERVIVPLKFLWKSGETIPKANIDIREDILKHLILEISFVTKKSAEDTREEIEKNLNK